MNGEKIAALSTVSASGIAFLIYFTGIHSMHSYYDNFGISWRWMQISIEDVMATGILAFIPSLLTLVGFALIVLSSWLVLQRYTNILPIFYGHSVALGLVGAPLAVIGLFLLAAYWGGAHGKDAYLNDLYGGDETYRLICTQDESRCRREYKNSVVFPSFRRVKLVGENLSLPGSKAERCLSLLAVNKDYIYLVRAKRGLRYQTQDRHERPPVYALRHASVRTMSFYPAPETCDDTD